jgi:FMN phosphatase YigB (HAD superfamily)
MKIIFDYNRTLFNPDSNAMYPGVFRVLETLAQKHELILITCNKPGRKNSSEIQEVAPYFQEVIFVERKTTTIFKKVAEPTEVSTNSPEVIVIGDRLQDEIRIGSKLNYITILVRHTSSDEDKEFFLQPTHTAKSMDHIEELIAQYEK